MIYESNLITVLPIFSSFERDSLKNQNKTKKKPLRFVSLGLVSKQCSRKQISIENPFSVSTPEWIHFFGNTLWGKMLRYL